MRSPRTLALAALDGLRKRLTAPAQRKSLTIVRSVDGTAWTFEPPDFTRRGGDYSGSSDGLTSSVIVPPLLWLMRTFPEAPMMVERNKDEQWQTVPGHALAKLIRKPNPYYNGRVLWMATIMDFCFGEAFWIKIRNKYGELLQLWWVPRGLMTPKTDPVEPLKVLYYEYRVGGRMYVLSPDNVVHFRFGMDPNCPVRGFSQLAAVMREVYTDEQASAFTASVLRNLGVIGIVISPKTGKVSEPEIKEVKEYLQKNFTGDRRGQALALGEPTDVNVMQYNLQGLDLGPIRDVSEERVCAALGVPAAVVGFGTGLQQTKVGATMREMIQLAWKGAVMPNQEIIADEVDRSLLPEFQANTDLFRTAFDASKVRALWEDVAGKHDRVRKDWESDLIMQSEARRELGYSVEKEHERYHFQITPTPAKPAVPQPAGGTGAESEDDDDPQT